MQEVEMQLVLDDVRRFRDEVDGMAGARAFFSAIASSPPSIDPRSPTALREGGEGTKKRHPEE